MNALLAGGTSLFIVLCVTAPVAAWILRRRTHAAVPLVLVFAPIVIGAAALLLERVFV